MQRMMIGAVARAYKPGSINVLATHLVGAQGVGKSMFARNLVPNQLFSEITTPLETLMKEQYRLHVAWLLELPEIDNYFSIRNIENFKNLVTSRVDEVRYPYASLAFQTATAVCDDWYD
jgi:predicted P-loop ATPase